MNYIKVVLNQQDITTGKSLKVITYANKYISTYLF